MARLVVVANRVPRASDSVAGGLAVGLEAALRERGGLWCGWSGRVRGQPEEQLLAEQHGRTTRLTFDLSEEELAGYYHGTANQALWPALHGMLERVRFDREAFGAYRAVNARIARLLAPHLRPDDLVWVHDYHLLPLPALLREQGFVGALGFFLHTPFPPPEILAALPGHRLLLEGLAAADLIGVQTRRDHDHLVGALTGVLGGRQRGDGRIELSGKAPCSGVFPIGIDADGFAAMAATPAARHQSERLRRWCGSGLVVGVDRLDYTKGIPLRLRAIDRLLELRPEHAGRLRLIQVSAPSRGDVPDYVRLRREVESLAGHINGRWSELDWSPIRFIHRSQRRLAALYRAARAALVTPLIDGMNLVAKEYVAAQDPADPGVLVLSRFAGAAERLEGALTVNPYDLDEVALAIDEALAMPEEERIVRFHSLLACVRGDDIHAWRRGFLEALDAAHQGRSCRPAARTAA
jgi:trehalose 6-phosphate synthase